MIIRIGEYRIPVHAMREKHRKDVRGLYTPDPRAISIDPAQVPFEQVDTLIHECLHAIWDALDMAKRVTEESAATQLGTALAELFRDNPALLPAMFAALHFDVPMIKEN